MAAYGPVFIFIATESLDLYGKIRKGCVPTSNVAVPYRICTYWPATLVIDEKWCRCKPKRLPKNHNKNSHSGSGIMWSTDSRGT